MHVALPPPARLHGSVERDLHVFRNRGLDRLGDDRDRLRERYAVLDHPMAAEVVRWLDGADTTDRRAEDA